MWTCEKVHGVKFLKRKGGKNSDRFNTERLILFWRVCKILCISASLLIASSSFVRHRSPTSSILSNARAQKKKTGRPQFSRQRRDWPTRAGAGKINEKGRFFAGKKKKEKRTKQMKKKNRDCIFLDGWFIARVGSFTFIFRSRRRSQTRMQHAIKRRTRIAPFQIFSPRPLRARVVRK